MPISLRPDRGDVPQIGDAAFDALLARALRPEEAVASLRPVVESFAALYAAPVYSGRAAEASAMSAFRALAATGPMAAPVGVPVGASVGAPVGVGGHGRPPSGAGRRARPRLGSIRLGLAAAAVVLAAACAAAAYTGDLPGPMQQVAHDVMGAPRTHSQPRPAPDRPATPPTPGNGAYGLCRAYERALADGHPAHNSVAFRRLATVAGGAAQVQAYCAQLVHPGNPTASHPAHPAHGKPSTAATPVTPPSHHGKPSWAATPGHGKPTG